MKKPTNKVKVVLPFDYMPNFPEDDLNAVRRVLHDRITAMHSRRSFIGTLQAELIRNLAYALRLSQEAFNELFSLFRSDFDAFFFSLSPEGLFRFFDEDGDGYLNEDEQLLIFTVLISFFYHLLEEASFYSMYDLDPMLRCMVDLTIEATITLEKSLRNKFYEDQMQRFGKIRGAKVASCEAANLVVLTAHEEMRNTRAGDFGRYQEKEEWATLKRLHQKKTLSNFNKYSEMRHFLIQEKLLGVAGKHEEAKNTLRNFNFFLDKELKRMQVGVEEAFKHANLNYQKRCQFKRSVLENKVLAEQEKIKQQQRDKKLLLEKNFNVAENKLKISQHKAVAQSAFGFLKNCKINLLKSENAMKKDFAMKINSNMKSIYQEEVIHSQVFRSVFLHRKLSLLDAKSEAEALEALRRVKDSQFNSRLSLRNLNEKPIPVNSKRNGSKGLTYSVGKSWRNPSSPIMQGNAFQLTMLYDDNLREIRNP
jgi:hypothetical protein